MNLETKFQIIKTYKHNRFLIPSAEEMKSYSFDDYWFPEELSPWFYLKSYNQLSANLKKRYNQLYALGTNEVFALFESDFISEILEKKVKEEKHPSAFTDLMKNFCEEEIKHARMFHQLNKIADPKLYHKNSLVLSKSANPLGIAILFFMKKMPDLMGAWIWISLFLEERSLMYSKYYMQKNNQHLNPTFREIHRLHMLEENYHVQLDEVIIEKYYMPLSQWRKKLSAWMLYRFVFSFKKPKRLSYCIAEILKNEFPNEKHSIQSCLEELPHLQNHLEFQKMSLGYDATHRLKKLLDKFPEMKSVSSLLYAD